MTLLRILAIGLLVWIAWFMIKNYLRKNQAQNQQNIPPQQDQQKMVRCTQCGAHLPEHVAVQKHGNRFYCREHAPK